MPRRTKRGSGDSIWKRCTGVMALPTKGGGYFAAAPFYQPAVATRLYKTKGTVMGTVAMKPDQVVSTLNSLIEINRDGQKGFQDAAEKIEAPQIKQFCFEQSRARAQFVGELQPEVRSLGGEPDNTGSVAAALHRGWIDLKSALGGGDHAILAATETGEDYAVKEYTKALDETLPAPVRDIVERQFQSVKQAHDKVKGMRDRLDK